jgi:hypothetical protein
MSTLCKEHRETSCGEGIVVIGLIWLSQLTQMYRCTLSCQYHAISPFFYHFTYLGECYLQDLRHVFGRFIDQDSEESKLR